MPRYIVERNFPDGLRVPLDEQGTRACGTVVENNLKSGVSWLQSYVSEDLGKTFCVYDGPNPEAIREAAGSNNLPVGAITQVRVLDPYFYRG